MRYLVLVSAMLAACLQAQVFTRGVGVYPGDPREDFSPTSQPAGNAYRNLALHRPAYQSSSYDYNLTAQLITDGIKETQPPRWLAVSSSAQGVLPREQRELLLDDNFATFLQSTGKDGWLQFEQGGDSQLVNRLEIEATLRSPGTEPEGWSIAALASDDAQNWKPAGMAEGRTLPTGEIHASLPLDTPVQSRFLRLQFHTGRQLDWTLSEVRFFNARQRVRLGGPWDFTSAWSSAGSNEEWVYVDLGALCAFDRIVTTWIARPASGVIEASADAKTWRVLQPLSSTADEVKLPQPVKARYVRIRMTSATANTRYILSELEVFGRGGSLPQPKPQPAATSNGTLHLAAGTWHLQRASLVSADGETLSQPGFSDAGWIPATVPGTVLASYLNIGAIPDPNFSDNIFAISDSFFYSDFWYRDEFIAPAPNGKHLWLDFDGINWKADVFLNGTRLGRIEGGFLRARFDVTSHIHPGQKNSLAVRIEKNATPGTVREKTWDTVGTNGGALGADNPTYHSSIGWDWIPTVRGRNTGIWGDVNLRLSGPITIHDPLVSSTVDLPGDGSANVTIETVLRNNDAQPATGTLHGRFGDVQFDEPATIPASSDSVLKKTIHLDHPNLWWPNGYGSPSLYPVELRFEQAGSVSDTKTFQAGVRQFTYRDDDGALRIFVNGRRFIPRGGNWGFSEYMLRYRAREYDAALRYHQDMHFNMVRNWVGQIGDEAFYQACDRHGVVVWQDFWLANPWDGPDPNDEDMFMRNARDLLLRIRSHPSIGLYCGRNEGYPPARLEQGFRDAIAELHPGLHYIPSSADDTVSGHGPYRAMPSTFYFTERATAKLHSELGMPNIMTIDSVRQTIPQDALWPQGRAWGQHDFSLHGAQNAESFVATIKNSYGAAANVDDWVELAQFLNYDGYRAMFEAQGRNRMGLLLWMTHPAWPTFVWQTYDYFLDPTAAYFGSKKACEPLHVQWNPVTNDVEVVNYSAGSLTGLKVHSSLFNLDGASKWDKSVTIDSAEDSIATPIKLDFPDDLSPVHFIRLELWRGQDLVSDNFYWRGKQQDNFQDLRKLPKVHIEAITKTEQRAGRWYLQTELRNTTKTPALMLHLKAVRANSGDRILPAIYSDNYISLLPGEKRAIRTEIAAEDARGERPKLLVDGFNLQ